jgi:hypothetical protein
MNASKNSTTFSKAHAAPATEKQQEQQAYEVLKKVAHSEKSCKHRTGTGFCTRSHKQCPFFLLN